MSDCLLLRPLHLAILAIYDMVLCGLLQVPAAACSSARDRPPHVTRPEHGLPSYVWLDTTESIVIAVDNNQLDEASAASSLARARSRQGALTILVAAAEP